MLNYESINIILVFFKFKSFLLQHDNLSDSPWTALNTNEDIPLHVYMICLCTEPNELTESQILCRSTQK